MMAPLFIAATVIGLAGLVCGVAGLVVRPRNVKRGMVLVAMFWLLLGVGMQVQAWDNALEHRRTSDESIAKAKALALETLSIARNTKSPENRDQALGLTEDALRLIAPDVSDHAFPSSQLMALINIVIGSVTLTLALTRPDILLTRRERSAQIIGRGTPLTEVRHER
jgi:hypothetical protein